MNVMRSSRHLHPFCFWPVSPQDINRSSQQDGYISRSKVNDHEDTRFLAKIPALVLKSLAAMQKTVSLPLFAVRMTACLRSDSDSSALHNRTILNIHRHSMDGHPSRTDPNLIAERVLTRPGNPVSRTFGEYDRSGAADILIRNRFIALVFRNELGPDVQ